MKDEEFKWIEEEFNFLNPNITNENGVDENQVDFNTFESIAGYTENPYDFTVFMNIYHTKLMNSAKERRADTTHMKHFKSVSDISELRFQYSNAMTDVEGGTSEMFSDMLLAGVFKMFMETIKEILDEY